MGVAWSRAEAPLERVDLTDDAAVHALVHEFRPDAVIHTAAERRPDVVERDAAAAQRLNVHAAATLAAACRQLDPPAYMVHLSTDYVFDGTQPPYAPGDTPHPLNRYGESKRDAEDAVNATALPGLATTVRVPVLYGETQYDGESAVNVLLGMVRASDASRASRPPATVDAHATRYPTNVADVARFLVDLCAWEQRMRHASDPVQAPQTLHFSAGEAMTKYDMCLALARAWSKAAAPFAASTAHLQPEFEVDASASTQRPEHCQLDVSASAALGLDVSCVAFEEWWTRYLAEKVAQEAGAPRGGADGAGPGEGGAGDQGTPHPGDGADAQPRLGEAGGGTGSGGGEGRGGEEAQEAEQAFAEHDGADAERGESGHVHDAARCSAETAAGGGPAQETHVCDAGTPDKAAPGNDDASRYGVPSPTGLGDAAALAGDAVSFQVRVSDPQRVGDPVTAHVVYTVRVVSNAPWLGKPEVSVLRRYSEFRWMHAALVNNHPGVIVPPIPEKMKLGRFAPEFVEFRRRSLEHALRKIVMHPLLQQDEDLVLFLTSMQLPADIAARDLVKGPVVTPEQKTYLGWGQSLQARRFRDTDDWFSQQQRYLNQLESRLRDLVASVMLVSQRRHSFASAQDELYRTLATLSGSALSRSVSTCFAALSDMKKRASDASRTLAEHEANVLGLAMYEYERLIGNVHKAFATRVDTWHAWQRAEDHVAKLRAKKAKGRDDAHVDATAHVLSNAEMHAAELRTRFEEVTRLCKQEFERFEQEKVTDVRAAFVAYTHTFQRVQHELLDEWQHCEGVLSRQAPRCAS
ncbi:Vacuolar protein sorting-associated protein vps5 [Malassezia sp. CBS 17886]|nr:Vacuolar protein sorting-associated protein vps5 [Malassezia sp. CBS 17886]